jgi:hypothetical protein
MLSRSFLNTCRLVHRLALDENENIPIINALMRLADKDYLIHVWLRPLLL